MRGLRGKSPITILSGLHARLAFPVVAYTEVRRAKSLFPDFELRPHFIDDEWGLSRPLCLSEELEVKLSDLKIQESWQYREVLAFLSGSDAVSDHFREFRKAVPESTAHEDYRRSRTPLLLGADPKDFVILISVSSQNLPVIRDGSHRAAVALVRGEQTIRAKLIAPFSPNFGWEWFIIPFYTTLRRSFRKRKSRV